MKKPKCFLAHKIALLLIGTGAILALLCMYFRSREPGGLWTAAAALLILPALAGVLIARRSIVCPHCGAQLFRGRFVRLFLPERCPGCGRELAKAPED